MPELVIKAMRIKSFLACFIFLLGTSASAQNSFVETNCDTSKIKFRAVAEVGFVNVLTNIFLNISYLGGGATGTDTGDVWPGDGYVKNWLNFLNISAGFVLKL